MLATILTVQTLRAALNSTTHTYVSLKYVQWNSTARISRLVPVSMHGTLDQPRHQCKV